MGDFYQIGKADQQNRWMLALQVTIGFLFIIDVVALFWVKKIESFNNHHGASSEMTCRVFRRY